MDRHLVSVEVCVEGCTSQWMQANGLSFDHLWLEGLNAQSVQGRSSVEQHGMTLHDIFQNVPYHGIPLVDDLLGRFDRLDDSALNELADDEWLIQLGRHILWKATFVQRHLRAYYDHRTGRIIDTLTEQILTEASLLSF